jgi:hypothetical protein
MNSYHVCLKEKFNEPKGVTVDHFLQHANIVFHANLTGDLTLIEVMRIALQSGNTSEYITQDNHSRSLQMWDRSELKDYIPPEKKVISSSLEISENSIAVADKQIPAVVDNSELNIIELPLNDDEMMTQTILKYTTIIDFYNLPIDIEKFIADKSYRQTEILFIS